MSKSHSRFSIEVEGTENRCPIGETVDNGNIAEGKIPVLSCEGACIRGEIARLAANMVAKEEPFARGCHGELLSVPDSAMARWIKQAEKVVLIDGCFLRCHSRIIENLLVKDKLAQFDALSVHRRRTGISDIDDIPEEQRIEATRQPVGDVLAPLRYVRLT